MGKQRAYFRKPLVCVLLIACTVVVYAPTLQHGFINYDDDLYLTDNPRVAGGLSPDHIGWAFTTTHAYNWHPLTWISHQIDASLFGLHPAGHHASNVALHALNSVLLFLLLNALTGAPLKSVVVAALFALHPLNVQSVAWLAERKNVLSTLFWLSSLWAYAHYALKRSSSGYMLSLLFFLFGLLAKPMLVTLPFTLLLFDYWPLRRWRSAPAAVNDTAVSLPGLLTEKIPFFLLSAGSCIVTFFVQSSTGAVRSLETLPIASRLWNAAVAYVAYLLKMLWPVRFSVFYPYQETSYFQGSLAVFALTLITVLVVRYARRLPYLPTGWFWYLGTLVPVIGIVQVGSQRMADRYAYIPLIGIFILVAWGAGELMKKAKWLKPVGVASAIAAVGLLMVISRHEVSHWRDSVTLFSRALEVDPDNQTAFYQLAKAHEALEDTPRAMGYYDRLLALNPEHLNGLTAKGALCAAQGDDATARSLFERAIAADDEYAPGHNNFGVMLLRKGDTDGAMRHFRKAIASNPDYANPHVNIADVLSQKGEAARAALHYREAVRIEPDNPVFHYKLGRLLGKTGDTKTAASHLSEAIKQDATYSDAYNEAGILFARQGDLEKAKRFFEKAVEVDPDNGEARENLALLEDRPEAPETTAGEPEKKL
jgi:tetratricopeptide (TPR) repeat protein